MFGGSPDFYGNAKLADTTVLQFSEWLEAIECMLERDSKREVGNLKERVGMGITR